MNVSWEVEGLSDLEKKLTALGAEIGTKALRNAARAAMKPVKDQMIQTAPFDEGKVGVAPEGADKQQTAARTQHLKDKISITTKKLDKKGGKNNAIAVRVGPTKPHARKAIAAEYGTEKQTATPFMRASLYDNKELVVRSMKSKLAIEIAKFANKGSN